MVLALLLAVPTARAGDSDKPSPAPRTAVQVGGVAVVLISANDKLYAFVDRIEDNAPAGDAEISVDLADGSSVAMTRASNGLFIAPFKRAGRMQDAFMVSVKSKDGAGAVPAEIGYGDLVVASASPSHSELRGRLAIAVVAGAIGAVSAVGATMWLRGRRRAETPAQPAPIS
jgi:hypothetical protein